MIYTPTARYKNLFENGLKDEKGIYKSIDTAFDNISSSSDDYDKQFHFVRDYIEDSLEDFESKYMGSFAFRLNGHYYVREAEYFDFTKVFFTKYLNILKYVKDKCSPN